MFQQGFKIKEGLLWKEARRKGAKRWDSQGGVGLIAWSHEIPGSRIHEDEGKR